MLRNFSDMIDNFLLILIDLKIKIKILRDITKNITCSFL